MIGSMGFTNPYVVCDRYIKEKWNAAIFREHEKYNISKFTGSKEVKQHYNFILEQNSTVTSENLVINDDYEIDQEIVQGIINEYPTDDGLGLVFIIESFNKFNDSANIWITFFDTNSKKILKTKKYSGRAGGFSVLNFWLGGVYDVCKQLRKDYKRW